MLEVHPNGSTNISRVSGLAHSPSTPTSLTPQLDWKHRIHKKMNKGRKLTRKETDFLQALAEADLVGKNAFRTLPAALVSHLCSFTPLPVGLLSVLSTPSLFTMTCTMELFLTHCSRWPAGGDHRLALAIADVDFSSDINFAARAPLWQPGTGSRWDWLTPGQAEWDVMPMKQRLQFVPAAFRDAPLPGDRLLFVDGQRVPNGERGEDGDEWDHSQEKIGSARAFQSVRVCMDACTHARSAHLTLTLDPAGVRNVRGGG